MTIARTTLTLVTGAVLSAGVILACSDDSPADADAQVECDCPAAEPPIQGRIVVVEDVMSVPGTGGAQADANCRDVADGAVLLGGACTLTGTSSDALRLFRSGNEIDSDHLHSCSWTNPDGIDLQGQVDAIARAICLVPAPE